MREKTFRGLGNAHRSLTETAKVLCFEVCVDYELGSMRKTQKSLTVYKFRDLIVFYKFCIIGTL